MLIAVLLAVVWPLGAFLFALVVGAAIKHAK